MHSCCSYMFTLIPYNPFKKCIPSLFSNFLFPASATDSFLLRANTSNCTVAPRDSLQIELAKTNSKKRKRKTNFRGKKIIIFQTAKFWLSPKAYQYSCQHQSSGRNEGKGRFWQIKGSCKFHPSQMHALSIRLQ